MRNSGRKIIQNDMKIGLTYTGTPEKHENYVRWLKDGEEIEVIRLSVEGGDIDSCDALVLSGGVIFILLFMGSIELCIAAIGMAA